MERDEIIQKLRDIAKPSCLKDLEISAEQISTEHLNWCLNTIETREGVDKAKWLIGLQINTNNTIDVKMETNEGRFYGVSLVL